METKFTLRNLLFSTLIILAITSCSSDKKEGETSSDVAEATADANGGSMGDPSMDPAADPGAAGDMAATDPLADPNASPDAMAATDAPADPNADPNAAPQDPNAVTDPNATAANPANPGDLPPADPLADSTTPPPSTDTAPTSPTPPPEIAGDAGAPPADQSSSGDLFGSAAATTGAADAGATPTEEKPKKSLPLAHLKDAPFKKGGQLLNTAYIAREGDTLESVSDKIFGENKVSMLKKGNPTLKKNLKTGDKVYFNSPNRPEDSEKMMTVYEDQGLPPTTYTTKEGDTLKSLAMEWYGSEASYKEIYAINRSLASTKELPAGTELQYWPASVSIVAYNNKAESVAAATPPPEAPAPAATTAPPMPPAPNLPPPAMANTAPGMDAANSLPPPPDLNAPPLPPPPSALKKKSSAADAMDNDTKMYVALAGALLVGGVAIAALRKRGNKRNQGVTQI